MKTKIILYIFIIVQSCISLAAGSNWDFRSFVGVGSSGIVSGLPATTSSYTAVGSQGYTTSNSYAPNTAIVYSGGFLVSYLFAPNFGIRSGMQVDPRYLSYTQTVAITSNVTTPVVIGSSSTSVSLNVTLVYLDLPILFVVPLAEWFDVYAGVNVPVSLLSYSSQSCASGSCTTTTGSGTGTYNTNGTVAEIGVDFNIGRFFIGMNYEPSFNSSTSPNNYTITTYSGKFGMKF